MSSSNIFGIPAPADSTKVMWDMQRGMSRFQAIPVVGALFVSPVKAVISLVQAVVGFLFAVVLGTVAIVCKNEWASEKAWIALKHTGLGLASLAYSLGNMISLGALGFTVERSCNPSSASNEATV
ncbi:MAG: hypothetical protein S4CHLAM2_01250 [Chlamydiales bacterium]|nr:hypothetical protein [Chlamydiales bacterium]